jgi:hypothetical protein
VNGPNTAVHITGKWDGDGSNQNSWLVVNNGAKVFIDSTAQLDTISDDGKLRSFAGRGDGTGTVEFADGFVANSRDTVPDVVEFYVWSPGNFRWITHSNTNFPDSNVEINQEDGGVWSVQTRAQTLTAGLTTSRSFTIETQADLTLARPGAFHSFDGTKTVTKTGLGTLTVAGEWAIGSGATVRTQDTSLGTTWTINAGKFVTLTDMGTASIGAGANGVFGAPGLPDADDVVSTKYIYNVNVNNAGAIADFDDSQHIQSLKLNSGGQANLNGFTNGGGSATTMQTDLLGVDTGTGTLNIGAGNTVTIRSGTGSFKLAAGTILNVQGGGVFNINGVQTHGVGATLNVVAGTTNLGTDAGASLSLVDSGIVNLSIAEHLGGITVNVGGKLNLNGGDLNAAGAGSNNGVINIPNGRTATFASSVSGGGSYIGAGIAVFNAGFSPGNSGSASVSFGGKANFAATSTVNIELGGILQGAQFDAIHVGGQLALAGALAISFINPGSYSPQSGDSFDILDWGALAGTFATLNLPSLPGGLNWNTGQLYTTGVLSISGLIGDYNQNGVVDAADYVLWRKSVGQSGSSLPADGDNDHAITQNDFAIWRAHFGQSLGGGSGSGSSLSGAVPEPSTLALAAFILVVSVSERFRPSNHCI